MSYPPFTIRAVFRDGAFWPLETVDLPEGTKVGLVVALDVSEPSPGCKIEPPLEPDPEKRKQIMQQLFKRMDENPWPLDRHFTRDELHERR